MNEVAVIRLVVIIKLIIAAEVIDLYSWTSEGKCIYPFGIRRIPNEVNPIN